MDVVRDTTFLYRTIDRGGNSLNRIGFAELLNWPYRRKMPKFREFPNFLKNSRILRSRA